MTLPKLCRGIFYCLFSFVGLLALIAVGWFAVAWDESQIRGAREPYLVMSGSDRMTVRWVTDEPGHGKVFYGTAPDQLTSSVSEARANYDHRATLSGLKPATRYYYRIKHNGKWLGKQAEWFYTAPNSGDEHVSRFWVLGDPGIAGPTQASVRDAALSWLLLNEREQGGYLDLVLTTGDNAYTNGTNQEFSRSFFNPYRTILKNIPVWPTFGNHDARRWAFYKLFDRPTQGELGGVASNDKSYFSFDYGQTHFIFLDSQYGDSSEDSPMLKWLISDLAYNTQPWTIVLFHHPPYTASSHNSDDYKDSKGRMSRMRSNVLPLLEAASVDLVITGHSHTYERSHLLQGHYGLSTSFHESMIVSQPQETAIGTPVYYKRPQATPSGTIYMVLGSSGEAFPSRSHPVTAYANDEPGSVVIDSEREQLQAYFINNKGQIRDHFIMRKEAASVGNVALR